MNDLTRLDTLEKKRVKVRKKIRDLQSIKRERLPGEVIHKKQLVAILKCAGFDNSYIAASLNEDNKTITNWLREPEVVEFYHYTLDHLTESANMLLRTYAIDAIETIAEIMRTSPDEKVALSAATEILDRIGVVKASRVESHQIQEKRTTLTDDGVVEALRKLTPEQQEEAAVMVEQLEKMVNENGPKSKSI
jgi:hypothetical protein